MRLSFEDDESRLTALLVEKSSSKNSTNSTRRILQNKLIIGVSWEEEAAN